MVLIKTNKAEGSFLGLGTHTWLEVQLGDEKITYSGSKAKDKLCAVIKNYKRDYDRDAAHGILEVTPPAGMSDKLWTEKVIASAENILTEMHLNYRFCGIFPWGKSKGYPRANCCTVLNRIITEAGGTIPEGKIKGFTPGLR